MAPFAGSPAEEVRDPYLSVCLKLKFEHSSKHLLNSRIPTFIEYLCFRRGFSHKDYNARLLTYIVILLTGLECLARIHFTIFKFL